MSKYKEHSEFTPVDMAEGWETPPGYPSGIKQKILSGYLDEENRKGNRSRLLKFDAGVYTTAPFIHEYNEEVFLVSGDLIVGNDADGAGGEAFTQATYASRPAGVWHGPFKSETGCVLFEIHWFEDE